MSILERAGLLVGLHLFTSHQLLFYLHPPDMIDLLLALVLLVSELPWYFVSKSFLPCTHTHQTPHTSKHTFVRTRTPMPPAPAEVPEEVAEVIPMHRGDWSCSRAYGLHIVLLYFSLAFALLLCLVGGYAYLDQTGRQATEGKQ